MTVDPSVQPPRKHTVGMVEKAMSEVGYSVRTDKPAKAQALELIKRLSEGDVLPIRRQQMRIRVTMPAKDAKRIGAKIKEEGEVEEEDAGEEWEVVSVAGRGLVVEDYWINTNEGERERDNGKKKGGVSRAVQL